MVGKNRGRRKTDMSVPEGVSGIWRHVSVTALATVVWAAGAYTGRFTTKDEDQKDLRTIAIAARNTELADVKKALQDGFARHDNDFKEMKGEVAEVRGDVQQIELLLARRGEK